MTDAATNGHVIRTRALTKRYGDLRAVDAVDLEVRAGDVYGFLGANGSGKTTTLRMLLGLVLPTSGEAEVLGMPMPTARRSNSCNVKDWSGCVSTAPSTRCTVGVKRKSTALTSSPNCG